MESCCCGNVLDAEKTITVTVSPCRCETPGPGQTVLIREESIPRGVTRQQYEERKRFGLPLVTPLERVQFQNRKWE